MHQQRRASDMSTLFDRHRGVGSSQPSQAEGHLSFMAQVKMRLKKEKTNGRSNYNNQDSQTASLSPPHRFVPHRPYSCDVETLADATLSVQCPPHPPSSVHNQQALTGSIRSGKPLLASLGTRRMNSSHQQLTSVADDEEQEEEPAPPMADEEDFRLDSSISCSPDDRSKEATIGYINLAIQKGASDGRPLNPKRLDCRGSTLTPVSSSSLEPRVDRGEKGLSINARPFLSGHNEYAQGRSNYSNRSSTNQVQRGQHKQQQQNRVNSSSRPGAPSDQQSFSLIDRLQQQLAGAGLRGAATSNQAVGSGGSSTSLLSQQESADAFRHLKCQNVVVSVTSFDDDLKPVTFSSSYHAGDRPQYQRSSSAQHQQKQARSPRGSLRRGKAVDLSSYENNHLLVSTSASSSPVKDNHHKGSSASTNSAGHNIVVPAPRSKRSSILRKLIGGSSSSRTVSGEDGSNSATSPSSSPNTLMAQSSLGSIVGGGARTGSSAGMAGSYAGGQDPMLGRSADFSSDSSDFKSEERVRRRILAHYDCVSICADARPLVNGTSRLKDAMTNSATGASQASKPFLISAMSTSDKQNLDSGLLSPDESTALLASDQCAGGKNNELILSCPYFRNEIGGEPIRHVSLSRDTFSGHSTPPAPRSSTVSCTCPSCLYPYDHDGTVSSTCLGNSNQSQNIDENQETWHRAATAAEASVLENLSNVYLGGRLCAKRQPQLVIEHVDHGAFYYRHCFSARAHQNYFGIDENLGPVAISVIRDKLEMFDPRRYALTSPYIYRVIVRLSDLTTFRGTILEESLPSYISAKETRDQQCSGQSGQQMSVSGQITPSPAATSTSGAPGGGPGGASASGAGGGSGGGYARGKIPVKELLELTIPELQISCLRLAVPVPRTEELLLKLDEQAVYTRYKVGILYCRAQQSTEEQMYNNEISGPAFDEFLDMLGQRVRLKGFDKYKGGLDCKGDTTGSYSLYTSYQQYEIMFHVSTMLPFTPQNRQQLARKRHIGNDIVTVVFQEPGALPFSPQAVRSHFQHVFIVVKAHKPNTDNVRYSIAVSRFKDVPRFGPAIPCGATFPKSKDFRDFLLTKIINAENAVHKSEKFAVMAARTRREFMRDLAENHTTSHTLDGGASGKIASILLGGSAKRKDRPKPKLFLDSFVRGAIVWEVQVLTQVEDFSLCRPVECFMGVSGDNLILIEQSTQEALFCTATHSIIGWTSHGNSLKLYYDHADVIILRTLDDEDSCEMQEIIKRLQAVTKGCETVEMILRRGPQGQLGFNIQHEGIVSDVEMYGYAWQAGLRQGSRLVEICKVSVATLTYERMVELLRTSVNIRVLVIPPLLEDGSPRRGCEDPYCSAVLGDEWPLVSSGSFSHSRTSLDASNATVATKQPSVQFSTQERKPSGASIGTARLSGPQPYETLSRRSLGTASAVGQHQAILRLQAKSEVGGTSEFRVSEPQDYGYESGPANGTNFSSKSLDDIQHKRDRRHSEDIRCTSADQGALLGAAHRYRPSAARASTHLTEDQWYTEHPITIEGGESGDTLIAPSGRNDTLSSSGSSEVSADLGDVTVHKKPTRPSELKRRVDRANSDMLQRVAAVAGVLERTSTDPSSAGVVSTPPRAPPLPPRSTRNLKCHSVLSASSGMGSVSDRSSSQSLNNSNLAVPPTKQRSSSTGSSVQENLIRLINDLESAGDIEEAMVISSALQRLSDDTSRRQRLVSPSHYRAGSPRSLRQRSPEKERGAEWSTLVDAAARAIEGLTHRSASGSNSGSPELSGYRLRLQAALQRVKLLEDKVDRVQTELDAERESKRDMEMEVLRLRDDNKRLDEECTHAKMELKKFTEWFFNAVENSAGGVGDLAGSRFPSGMIPFADDSDRKS